jgi:ribosome-binding protein aMBF1 (putative translation factor)
VQLPRGHLFLRRLYFTTNSPLKSSFSQKLHYNFPVCKLGLVEVDAAMLRELRHRRVLTMEELAEKAGVGRNTIWRLEHGVMGAQPRTIRKLAKALDVEPEALVKMEGGDAR